MSLSSRLILLVIGFLVLFSALPSQTKYSQVRVQSRSRSEMQKIAHLGIDLEGAGRNTPNAIDLLVSDREMDRLQSAGIPFTVLIEDWYQFYDEREAQEEVTLAEAVAGSVVKHFRLGSMGGSLTYPELIAELDSMRSYYPNLISQRDSIGASIEGRTLWAVRISKNPDVEEAEPRALYTALHHAREGAGMMSLIYAMWYLLENYGIDQEVTTLLDHRDLCFVPIVNPDGYEYNRSYRPTGGGTWRKNRRLNTNGSYGIDLNRNYGFQWGYDNEGSSPNPSDETFRGAAAFSEPETGTIRDFCIAKKFAVALNYHTYGNLMIYPWGYSDSDGADSAIYRQMGIGLTLVNRYTYGTGGQTVGYVTNGDSDDWMYGDTASKPRIFSITPEVGNQSDGFWPLKTRILPMAMENLQPIMYMAHAAGQFVAVKNFNLENNKTNDTLTLRLHFMNKGVKEQTPSVQVQLSSNEVDFLDPASFALQWKTQNTVTVRVRPKRFDLQDYMARVYVELSGTDVLVRDSAIFRIIPPDVIFSDNAENGRLFWNVSTTKTGANWDTTRAAARSGIFSFSESPYSNYRDTLSSQMTLISNVPLSGSDAEFRFWGKWQLESDYDFLRVEISTDQGVNWLPLSGKYTKDWSAIGRIFGVRHEWTEEVMNLKPYLGRNALFRFNFKSDQNVNMEGCFIDDISIVSYPPFNALVEKSQMPFVFSLDQNYPNPFNPSTIINYSFVNFCHVRLAITDILGREVKVLVNEKQPAGKYSVKWDARGFPSGIYFYRLTAGMFTTTRRMLLIK